MKALKVKCDNNEKGCPWVNELRCLDDHLQVCDYDLVPCTNKCKTGNTHSKIKRILRKDLETHLANDCQRRQHKCQHCEEVSEFEFITTKHLQKCPRFSIPCPNLHCGAIMFPCNLTTHRSKCKYERVACKYAEVGCEERIMRKDLQEHEQDDKLHLHVAVRTILPLTKKIKQLENLCDKIDQAENVFIFKLKEFNRHKRMDLKFCSPPFYSSHTGYKFCIQVYAKGYHGSTGTHVSVYGNLMKGDNDDSLHWPFVGTMTIELLNQLEDNNHSKVFITFQADDVCSQRVMEGERSVTVKGAPNLISHAELAYNSVKNCQYLKEDTLVLRVMMRVADYKPCLECTA